MRHVMTMAAACVLSAALGAEATAVGGGATRLSPAEAIARHKAMMSAMTPEQRAEYQAKAKARALERTGGLVRDTSVQAGRMIVVNSQDAVPVAELAKPVAKLAGFLRTKIDIVGGTAPSMPFDSAAYLAAQDANAAVFLVSTNSLPALVVVPEDRWAVVNVARLGKENLSVRTQKELLRGFAFVCGGAATSFKQTLVSPITSPADLDQVMGAQLPIDSLNAIAQYLPGIGVKPYREASYRRAAREGWAPPPTNNVQKAIWEKIKADKERGPTNPITIPPPNKKK